MLTNPFRENHHCITGLLKCRHRSGPLSNQNPCRQQDGSDEIQPENLKETLRVCSRDQRLDKSQDSRDIYKDADSAVLHEASCDQGRPKKDDEGVLLRERLEEDQKAESEGVIDRAGL